jgi:hypothetical protein
MRRALVTRLIRVALAAALTIAFADRAVAGPILMSNLTVQVGEDADLGLVADFTGGLQTQPFDVFFDGYQLSLEENGNFIDPFAPPIVVIDPLFSPFSPVFRLAAGNSLADDTLLFRIGGLRAGVTYTASIAFFQLEMDGSFPELVPETFEFTPGSPAPVPEPSTLILTGFGIAALLRKRLTKRGA